MPMPIPALLECNSFKRQHQRLPFVYYFSFSFFAPPAQQTVVTNACESCSAPESAIKRAAFKQQQTENFKNAIAANKAAKASLKKIAYERGLKYSREYRTAEKKLVVLRRKAKKQGGYFLESKPKVAVVTRIRGIAKVPPKQRKILQLLRLRQIFNTVFGDSTNHGEHAARRRALHRVRVPLATHCARHGIQAWLPEDQRPACEDPRQPDDQGQVQQRGHCVRRGRGEPDLHQREALPHGDERPVALQARTPHWWHAPEAPPLCRGGDYGNRDALINRFLSRMI
ncbi:Ribosomal L30 N terminal domain [Trypanosoma vivax]|nr:Ribosomal L30 N terminal domain [Trypanosoma vivax]